MIVQGRVVIDKSEILGLVERVEQLSDDVAAKEQEALELGGRACCGAVFAAVDGNSGAEFLRENGRILRPGDAIGPKLITREDGVLMRGIAIWRQSQENI